MKLSQENEKKMMKPMKQNINTFLAFLILVILVFSFKANSQTIEWEKSFGGSQDDNGYEIKKTTDGGFIIVGSAESTNGDLTGNNGPIGTRDIWVIKLDDSGNKEWQRNYGGSKNDDGRSIAQTTDGGYIITGAIESSDGDISTNNGSRDFWIFKVDSFGNIQWEKSYGASNWDFPESIKETPDSGFIVLGITYLTSSSKLNYRVYKLDSNGNMEWQKRYGGSEDEYSGSIEVTSDQGYIIAGRSRSNDDDVGGNYGDYDFWIVKIDQAGNIQWEKNYGGSEQERANSIKETPDGGFIIAGGSRSNDYDVTNNYGEFDCWVIKIDSSGNIQWEKNYGGSDMDSGFSVDLTYDGGYIITGYTESNDYDVSENKGSADYWLFKLDQNGNLEWEKSYGGTYLDISYSLVVIDENNYVFTGQCRSSNGDITNHKGGDDLWIVKVKEETNSIETEKEIPNIEILPNPSFGNFSIQSKELYGAFDIIFYDELGRIIFKNESVFEQVNLTGIPPGIYWVKISNNEFMTLKKVIIF